ncbi:hypothetical protein [Leptolyngbya iicbica]
MRLIWVMTVMIGSVLLGGWMAYVTTPRPVRSFIPDVTPLSNWHASAIGALVVNREVSR